MILLCDFPFAGSDGLSLEIESPFLFAWRSDSSTCLHILTLSHEEHGKNWMQLAWKRHSFKIGL